MKNTSLGLRYRKTSFRDRYYGNTCLVLDCRLSAKFQVAIVVLKKKE